MFNVVLFEPEIAPNSGNIIRLCANAGARLHLIEPLGFALDDAKLRRAGLDYHEYAQVERHHSLDACLEAVAPPALLAFTTRGTRDLGACVYPAGCVLLFGPESRGLPADILGAIPRDRHIRIPMRAVSRSLNLSNAVAIALYEAWRQHDYAGALKAHSPPTPTACG